MNQISLNFKIIESGEQLIIDGIIFTRTVLVTLLIDNLPSNKMKHLDIALIVFSELLRSLSESGCYLIFTSASGIADDGGWEGVEVNYIRDLVIWDFEVEEETYHFEFDAQQYEREIRAMENKLALLSQRLELEPAQVFFPESWD